MNRFASSGALWNSPNGRSQVEDHGFCRRLDRFGEWRTIQAHFIQQEAFDSTGSASAPNDGAMGRPILVK